MANLLKRGIDPYADAGIMDERTGDIGPVKLSLTGSVAALDLPNPYVGRIREWILVVTDATTVGSGGTLVELQANGVTLDSVNIQEAIPAGTVFRRAIDDAVNDFVDQNDSIVLAVPDSQLGTGDAFVSVRVSAEQ